LIIHLNGGIQMLNWISNKIKDLLSWSLSHTPIPLLGFTSIHLGAYLSDLRSSLRSIRLTSGTVLISNGNRIAIVIRGLIENIVHWWNDRLHLLFFFNDLNITIRVTINFNSCRSRNSLLFSFFLLIRLSN
jgi:hypothetical protein